MCKRAGLPKLPSGAVFFFPLLSGRRRKAVKLPQSPNTYTSAAQHSSEEPRTSRQHNKFSALVANSVRGWLLPVHLPLFFSSKNHSLLRDSVLFFFIFVPSILDLFFFDCPIYARHRLHLDIDVHTTLYS
ncbi:hypothetical protein LMH87_011084 [Akanthomyces muscarius]|uniref:Transmembrane protein n=1 Tax=Akanthomyces muscarius TaxID=2231603 RepID=A0A9W8Q9Y5_AKAMU|nr:hypothetical protein LMH87_011084 [Akanthomyces muscarius]KAJ4150331.1 hypothetical protein LMH87_011084 [Akanthomyces muscarius]